MTKEILELIKQTINEIKKTKRIKGIKKLDFGFDLLNLIKQKDKGDLAYNNENKKKIFL